MRIYLAIERHWGQPPGWLSAQTPEVQAELWADWELPEVARGVASR